MLGDGPNASPLTRREPSEQNHRRRRSASDWLVVDDQEAVQPVLPLSPATPMGRIISSPGDFRAFSGFSNTDPLRLEKASHAAKTTQEGGQWLPVNGPLLTSLSTLDLSLTDPRNNDTYEDTQTGSLARRTLALKSGPSADFSVISTPPVSAPGTFDAPVRKLRARLSSLGLPFRRQQQQQDLKELNTAAAVAVDIFPSASPSPASAPYSLEDEQDSFLANAHMHSSFTGSERRGANSSLSYNDMQMVAVNLLSIGPQRQSPRVHAVRPQAQSPPHLTSPSPPRRPSQQTATTRGRAFTLSHLRRRVTSSATTPSETKVKSHARNVSAPMKALSVAQPIVVRRLRTESFESSESSGDSQEPQQSGQGPRSVVLVRHVTATPKRRMGDLPTAWPHTPMSKQSAATIASPLPLNVLVPQGNEPEILLPTRPLEIRKSQTSQHEDVASDLRVHVRRSSNSTSSMDTRYDMLSSAEAEEASELSVTSPAVPVFHIEYQAPPAGASDQIDGTAHRQKYHLRNLSSYLPYRPLDNSNFLRAPKKVLVAKWKARQRRLSVGALPTRLSSTLQREWTRGMGDTTWGSHFSRSASVQQLPSWEKKHLELFGASDSVPEAVDQSWPREKVPVERPPVWLLRQAMKRQHTLAPLLVPQQSAFSQRTLHNDMLDLPTPSPSPLSPTFGDRLLPHASQHRSLSLAEELDIQSHLRNTSISTYNSFYPSRLSLIPPNAWLFLFGFLFPPLWWFGAFFPRLSSNMDRYGRCVRKSFANQDILQRVAPPRTAIDLEKASAAESQDMPWWMAVSEPTSPVEAMDDSHIWSAQKSECKSTQCYTLDRD